MAIEVKSFFEVKTKPTSTWTVDYIDTSLGGCCGFVPPRKTVKLVQKKKPTQTQIENAINQGKG